MKTNWQREYEALIETCAQCSEALSTWELEFLDSLKVQLAMGRQPTQKQVSRLSLLWATTTKVVRIE